MKTGQAQVEGCGGRVKRSFTPGTQGDSRGRPEPLMASGNVASVAVRGAVRQRSGTSGHARRRGDRLKGTLIARA